MEPRDTGIDDLLRRSMAAPVPTLPTDFELCIIRDLPQNSQALDRYRRILLTCYALISVMTSTMVMRGQGLDWGFVSLLILGPLALVATVPLLRRATHSTLRHSAKR